MLNGADFRRMRLRLDLTTEELAQRVGKSRKTIENWEKLKGKPDLDVFFKVAVMCGFQMKLAPFLDEFDELKNIFGDTTGETEDGTFKQRKRVKTRKKSKKSNASSNMKSEDPIE